MSYLFSSDLVHVTIVRSVLCMLQLLIIFIFFYLWKMPSVERVKMGFTVHVLLNNAVDVNLCNNNGDNILRGACEKRQETNYFL